MRLFARLREGRLFMRAQMGALRKLEDFDIVLEIGFHQEQGTPLGMKDLYMLDLMSVATLQRRLRKLRRQGVIVHKRSSADARAVELTLHPRVFKAFARYVEIIAPERDES